MFIKSYIFNWIIQTEFNIYDQYSINFEILHSKPKGVLDKIMI